jgi:hypothetical protein
VFDWLKKKKCPKASIDHLDALLQGLFGYEEGRALTFLNNSDTILTAVADVNKGLQSR